MKVERKCERIKKTHAPRDEEQTSSPMSFTVRYPSRPNIFSQ